MKYFLNIPITFYSNKTSKKYYIHPIKIMKKFLKLYSTKKFTPNKSLILKSRIILPKH